MRLIRQLAHAGVGLAITALLASATAQQAEKVARVGFLALSAAVPGPLLGVQQALGALGYVEGKNVVYEFRYAAWQTERLPELAAELVRQKVDVIVALTNIPGFAAKRTTDKVPIVVWGIHGGVATGLVRSLHRPGGNVTGVESLAPELDAKRIELLKAVVPKVARLGVVYNPEDQGSPVHLDSVREAARMLGMVIVPMPVKRPADFDTVVSDAAMDSIDALLPLGDPLTGSHPHRIVPVASKRRVPTVCEFRSFVEAGCMLSYGPTFDEFSAIVARQIDRILKGARVEDLPVQQAARFETLLNMKTAKALGITIPASIRARADQLIE
jgi:putative ABC transport system substrate-binding protein